MKYIQYDEAVKKIHDIMENVKDENVQEVWSAVTDLWADYEDSVVNSVCED